jgi:hypothetical protein
MPSVAVIRCQQCEAAWEHLVGRGALPVISDCACGGQRQVSRIFFAPTNRSAPTTRGRDAAPPPTPGRWSELA